MCLRAADSPATTAARERLENLKSLAALGAASQRQVEQAEHVLQQTIDDEIIARTIYGEVTIEELTEEQAAAMKDAARRLLEREQAQLGEAAKLVDAGVTPRMSLIPYEENVARAEKTMEIAAERARTVMELAAMVRAEETLESSMDTPMQGPMPVLTRFAGSRPLSESALKKIVLAYQAQFDRKLPISAKGQTALHQSLGFDHRGRIDVAVNPDAPEGKWLMQSLEEAQIPYLAFRAAVPGQATAPHIHLGPPSLRLRQSD